MEKQGSNKIHLDGLQKQNVFKVSEDYFENLPFKIQSKIPSKTKSFDFAVIFSRPAFKVLSVVLVVIISVVIWFFNHSTTHTLANNSDGLKDVSQSEILDYLLANYSEEEIMEEVVKTVPDVNLTARETEEEYLLREIGEEEVQEQIIQL